jgi:hypothetical protein
MAFLCGRIQNTSIPKKGGNFEKTQKPVFCSTIFVFGIPIANVSDAKLRLLGIYAEI